MADVYGECIMEWPIGVAAELMSGCTVASGPVQPCSIEASRSLHKRSVSCSALADGVVARATHKSIVTEDELSMYSTESNVSETSATTCTTVAPAAEALAVEAESKSLHHHHHHQHRHKQKHKQQYKMMSLSAHERSRSCSADDLPSTHAMLYGSDPSLVTQVDDRRPRSYTVPTRQQTAHHVKFASNSAPGLSTRPAGATGAPRSNNRSPNRHTNMSNAPLAHVVVSGRRSPAYSSNGALKQQGHSSGLAVGGSTAAVQGMPLVPRPDRIMAECLKPEHIAKGFAAHWFSRRMLDVFDGSCTAAPAPQLLAQVPAYAGLHLWVVRPPRSRQWVPVHLGSADNLHQALKNYIHLDGSCGPLLESFKHKVMLDLMCRGFAVQVRFRPVKPGFSTAKADELTKLRLFDFPLNDRDNGGCRPIELPNGWQVVEYPVLNKATDAVFEGLFGPRRML